MKRLTLAAMVAAMALSVPASARIWQITPDGTGDVPTIKAGVDAAANGDTLLLADGVYTGSGNYEVSYRGKAITISSASGNPFGCVVDCQGSNNYYRRGFLFYSMEGPGSVLQGVTIINGYGYEGGAIWCWRASPTIRNCIISHNVATHAGGGLYCGGSSFADVTNVTFFENASTMGGSVYCTEDSRPQIQNTIISYSLSGGAVGVGDGYSVPDLYCCDIYGNAGGDWTGAIEDQMGLNGNMGLDPLFCLDDNPGEPFTIDSYSPCSGINHPECGLVGAADVGCGSTTSSIDAVIDIDPNTLNSKSKGRFITCYIELPTGIDPANIDVSTVTFNDAVTAEPHPVEIGDYDSDGTPDLMVKFSREEVLEAINGIGQVEVTVSGQVDGQVFVGTDSIKVLGQTAALLNSEERASDFVSITPPPIVNSSSGAMIHYNLPEAGFAKLTIFDVTGRVVTTLVEQVSAAGTYSVSWDGRDESGAKVASGVYFANLETSKEAVTGKFMVVR